MTQLERIASEHRLIIRKDSCGDPIIPSSRKTGRGHLYTDEGKICLCFTDDGYRSFESAWPKEAALRRLAPFLVRVKQEGDYEFIGEIADTRQSIETAIRVLRIKRRMKTFGISRPVPQAFNRRPKSRATNGPKIDRQGLGEGKGRGNVSDPKNGLKPGL